MSMAMVMGLPLVAGLGLLYWSEQIKEDHPILTMAFRFMFIPLVWLSIHFAVIYVGLIYSANSELVIQLAQFSYYLGWLFFGIGVYYSFVVFGNIKDIIMQKKRDKEDAKYG